MVAVGNPIFELLKSFQRSTLLVDLSKHNPALLEGKPPKLTSMTSYLPTLPDFSGRIRKTGPATGNFVISTGIDNE